MPRTFDCVIAEAGPELSRVGDRHALKHAHAGWTHVGKAQWSARHSGAVESAEKARLSRAVQAVNRTAGAPQDGCDQGIARQ